MSNRAVISGVCGQDGSHLAEYLLELGYDVYGIYRRVSSGNDFSNIAAIQNHQRFHLIAGDITDAAFMNSLIADLKPDEYYGLAAQSHVGYSFVAPLATLEATGTAVLIALEAIRQFSPKTRFYNSASSEVFGGIACPAEGYDETSPHHPRSPYGCAKSFGIMITKNYREAHKLFAVSGILFNHSSHVGRRGRDFAVRKISYGLASVKLGLEKTVKMGDLSAVRDEGCALEYVTGQHLLLQQNCPDDFVLATGVTASIEEMFRYTASIANLDFNEVYELDRRFIRPSEVNFLKGRSDRIRALGWEPQYDWKRLLKEMYEYDLALLSSTTR